MVYRQRLARLPHPPRRLSRAISPHPCHHEALIRAQRRRSTASGRHEARRTIRRMSSAAAIPTPPAPPP